MLPLTLRQRLALLIMFIVPILASLKMFGLIPDAVLYVGLLALVLSLFLFFSAVNTQTKVRMSAGQTVYEYVSKAGLTEKDMRELISYGKDGYRVAFGRGPDPPYYQVRMTTRPFSPGEIPKEEDYLPWDEAKRVIINRAVREVTGQDKSEEHDTV